MNKKNINERDTWKKRNKKNDLWSCLNFENPQELEKFLSWCTYKEKKDFIKNLSQKLWIHTDSIIFTLLKNNIVKKTSKYDIRKILYIIKFINENEKEKLNISPYIETFITKHNSHHRMNYNLFKTSWIEIILWVIKALKEKKEEDYQFIDKEMIHHLTYKILLDKKIPNSEKLKLIYPEGEELCDLMNKITDFVGFINNEVLLLIEKYITDENDLRWFYHFFKNWEWKFILQEPWSKDGLSDIMNFMEEWINLKEFIYFTQLINSILETPIESRNKEIISKWVLDVLLWIIDFIESERKRLEKNEPIKYDENKITANIVIEQMYLKILQNEISDKITDIIPKDNLNMFFSFIAKKYERYDDKIWFNYFFRSWMNQSTCDNIWNLAKIMIFLDKGENIDKLFYFCDLFNQETNKKEEKNDWNWLEIIIGIINFVKSWNKKFNYQEIKKNIENYNK